MTKDNPINAHEVLARKRIDFGVPVDDGKLVSCADLVDYVENLSMPESPARAHLPDAVHIADLPAGTAITFRNGRMFVARPGMPAAYLDGTKLVEIELSATHLPLAEVKPVFDPYVFHVEQYENENASIEHRNESGEMAAR